MNYRVGDHQPRRKQRPPPTPPVLETNKRETPNTNITQLRNYTNSSKEKKTHKHPKLEWHVHSKNYQPRTKNQKPTYRTIKRLTNKQEQDKPRTPIKGNKQESTIPCPEEADLREQTLPKGLHPVTEV